MTKRLTDGPASVFGIDEVEAELTGKFNGTIAVCTGCAKEAPDVRFEATVFPRTETDLEVKRPRIYRGPDRLPKLPLDYHRYRRYRG